MSWLSLLFEGAVSVLLLVMIAYCIKLNRLLGGLRERDAEIEDLLIRFGDASDRAEASVAVLKAAGVEAERSVRVATERAETARDELVSLLRNANRGDGGMEPKSSLNVALQMPPAPAPAPAEVDDGQGSVYPPEFFENQTGPVPFSKPSQDGAWSEAELNALRAIRTARAGD